MLPLESHRIIRALRQGVKERPPPVVVAHRGHGLLIASNAVHSRSSDSHVTPLALRPARRVHYQHVVAGTHRRLQMAVGFPAGAVADAVGERGTMVVLTLACIGIVAVGWLGSRTMRSMHAAAEAAA